MSLQYIGLMTSKKSHWFYIFFKKKRNLIIIKLTTTIDRIGDSRMNKFINTTLQLKDENIIFEDKVEEMTVKNGSKKSRITLTKISGLPAYL